MFGFVTANTVELTKEQHTRYGAVYCGICRRIQAQCGELARLSLQYDMVFLALLLMSLYEPEEASGAGRCMVHPVKKKPWVDSPCIRYAADMNVALAYYKCLDDWHDEKKPAAKALAAGYEKYMPRLEGQYPRQCAAIRDCIARLTQLEGDGCSNPDEPAAAFGALMAELMVFRQDRWEGPLRQLGDGLGRFIYLMDAALDYDRDRKKGSYNPYLAMGGEQNRQHWEQYLVNTMARATQAFEVLPLVQDKPLLDNILYSGVWVRWHGKKRKEAAEHDGSVSGAGGQS